MVHAMGKAAPGGAKNGRFLAIEFAILGSGYRFLSRLAHEFGHLQNPAGSVHRGIERDRVPKLAFFVSHLLISSRASPFAGLFFEMESKSDAMKRRRLV